MHGLLRCNINAGVHAHTRSRRVTQRCHNSPETGLESANDVTYRKRAEDFGNFEKKSVELRTRHLTRRVDFRDSQRRDEFARYGRRTCSGGRWKSQHRKIVYLSPYVEEPLNPKVIKSFVPELRSRKCFSCLGFLCSMYICYEHSMYVSHIRIMGMVHIVRILEYRLFYLF